MNSSEILLEKFEKQSLVGQKTFFEFILTFARFENALISNGYHLTRFHQIVFPDWDRFFTEIVAHHPTPEDNEELSDAIRYFLDTPPKLLKEVDGEIVWEGRIFDEDTPDIEKLSFAVKSARNNLFHGGKFNGTVEEGATRNFMLLEHGLVLLNYWVTLNGDIKNSFLRDFLIS